MEKTYNVSEAAELMGVSVKTMQRWDRDGKLVANRTPSNRRYYTNDQLLSIRMNETREGYKKLTSKFIEYLKNGNFEDAFRFVLNDSTCGFDFGTKLIDEFGNWVFVTGMYGDGSGSTVTILNFEDDENRDDEDWENEYDRIYNYFCSNYGDWKPVF